MRIRVASNPSDTPVYEQTNDLCILGAVSPYSDDGAALLDASQGWTCNLFNMWLEHYPLDVPRTGIWVWEGQCTTITRGKKIDYEFVGRFRLPSKHEMERMELGQMPLTEHHGKLVAFPVYQSLNLK